MVGLHLVHTLSACKTMFVLACRLPRLLHSHAFLPDMCVCVCTQALVCMTACIFADACMQMYCVCASMYVV